MASPDRLDTTADDQADSLIAVPAKPDSAHRQRVRDWAQGQLDQASTAGRLRQRPVIDAGDTRSVTLRVAGQQRRRLINWASNDYLGMASALTVANSARKALRSFGAGATAARLLSGGLAIHQRLEVRLANWLGTESALLTTTGYQANVAALPVLAQSRHHALIIDRLCHASTYDGARLAAAPLQRFAHNDINDLRTQLQRAQDAERRIVCVESVYSMDGDEAPLADIAEVCAAHDAWLVVDEAHALGVYGPGGRGLCAQHGVRPDLLIGTCSKSLGSQGGILAGDQPLIEVLVNSARSFMYSTAAVPAACGAALRSLDHLRDQPQMGTQLLECAAQLRKQLAAQGWIIPAGQGPIIPVMVGTEVQALRYAKRLQDLGHHCPAIRPPTVPEGACRLRLTLTSAHKAVDIRRLLEAMAALRQAG